MIDKGATTLEITTESKIINEVDEIIGTINKTSKTYNSIDAKNVRGFLINLANNISSGLDPGGEISGTLGHLGAYECYGNSDNLVKFARFRLLEIRRSYL